MPKKKSSQEDAKLSRGLYVAARSLGWLIPQSEQEVADADDLLESSEEPASLDPFEVLDQEPILSRRPFTHVPSPPEYEAELRRAARLAAGEVSEDIEERMRNDRRRAEEESDGS